MTAFPKIHFLFYLSIFIIILKYHPKSIISTITCVCNGCDIIKPQLLSLAFVLPIKEDSEYCIPFQKHEEKSSQRKLQALKGVTYICFHIYFHHILGILIHRVSDFNLFYIQDMRIRKMSDFFLVLVLLSSTLWKWNK